MLSSKVVMSNDKLQKKNKMLQILSEFVTMRFSLKDNKCYLNELNRKQVVQVIHEEKVEQPTSFSKSLQTKLHKKKVSKSNLFTKVKTPITQTPKKQEIIIQPAPFKLKYLQKLSQQHFLIGNCYQLDMIKIQGKIDSYINVQYKWSINNAQPINTLSVQTKFGLIALGGRKTLSTYRYNLKNDTLAPELIVECKHDQKIFQVRFVKNSGIYILLQTKLEFYQINWVCEKAEMIRTFQMPYNVPKTHRLFRVPPPVDNTLHLYFYQQKLQIQEKSKFGLWKMSLISHSNMSNPQRGNIIRIYDIDKQLQQKIHIYNYSKQICLIQFQNQIIAFRNGFVIDAVTTNFHKQNCFLKYIASNRTILHFLDSTIDLYHLQMTERTKPQTIELECLDSIQFKASQFGLPSQPFNILQLKKNSYAIFYETNINKGGNNPNLQYTFAVTYQIDLESKIEEVFPSKQEIKNYTMEQLHDKCIIVKKMGLSTQQAYHSLWRRTNRSSIQDFQILLSTQHYPTIQYEIQKKMKNESMNVRELIKIYNQCLQLLRERVMSPTCNVNNLIEFASCHFLIKKLDMYRYIQNIIRQNATKQSQPIIQNIFQFQNINMVKSQFPVTSLLEPQPQLQFQLSAPVQSENESSRQKQKQVTNIVMNIKDYYEYRQMSIINELVEQITSYINKPSPDFLIKIKSMFLYFKLIFRLYYHQILQKLVQNCKQKLIDILNILPETLPFVQKSQEADMLRLWEPVSEEEVDSNLFINQMKTIDNRQKIQQFGKCLWFKRNLNSAHGVILIEDSAIRDHIRETNECDHVFYIFLCKICNLKCKDNSTDRLINYLQEKYPLFPAHLKGKFQLYSKLYQQYFNSNRTFYSFLKLRESELFRMYFQRQKIQKNGFILKKIKPLYQQKLHNGKDIFNNGMYQYFSSPESSVSDLKSLLNKLNNQKNEFHISSQKLYEVLINAIMQKIKIGSDADTPIDQVLVYIQNIPFPIHNQKIMTNLEYIQQINYQSEMLKKIKVNMTLQQIVNKGEDVIQLMVEHQIKRHDVYSIKDTRNLRLHAFKILAEVQCRQSNIYGDKYKNYALKMFLVNIMTTLQMIKNCNDLLNDPILIKQFEINVNFKEEVVKFLYQWKLCQKKIEPDYYSNHKPYIKALLQLLDQDNPMREFIELSIQYADELSFKDGYNIQYPLFPTFHYYPSLKQFEEVFICLNAKEMASLQSQKKLQKLFQIMIRLKQLGELKLVSQQKQINQLYEYKLKHQLYEIYIIRLVQLGQIKAALSSVFTLLKIPTQYPQYNIIYPILIIQKLFSQLLHNTILMFCQLVTYYFDAPLQLATIIKNILSGPQSNQDLQQYVKRHIRSKMNKLFYNINNPIITKQLKNVNSDFSQNVKTNQMMESCLMHITQLNDVYIKSYHLNIIFRIMCHEPLAVSKFIWAKKQGINMKSFRSFISYMSLQPPFDAKVLLESVKQVLNIISYRQTHNIFFTQILKYIGQLFSEETNIRTSQNKALQLIQESTDIIDKKIQDINDNCIQIDLKQSIDYNELLQNPGKYLNKSSSQYLYKDKDDGYERVVDQLSIKTKKRDKLFVSFDRKVESRQMSKDQTTVNRMFDEIPQPQTHRNRKKSQYFPQMVQIVKNILPTTANLFIQSIIPTDSQTQQDKRDISRCKFPTIFDKIVQDPKQNMSSQININFKDSVNQQISGIILNLKQTNSLLMVQNQHKQQKQNNINATLINKDQNDNLCYVINIEHKQEPTPLPTMMNQLLNSVQSADGAFDLSLLKIQSRKKNFNQYLHQLLQLIYTNQKISFFKRINLITTIAKEYEKKKKNISNKLEPAQLGLTLIGKAAVNGVASEPQTYFNKDIIAFFKRLGKFKLIQDLPFKVTEMFPISQLFDCQSQAAIFDSFRVKMRQMLTFLNVFLTIQFIDQSFSNKSYKDDVIIDFMISKTRANLRQNNIIVRNSCKQKILGLMEYMNQGKHRIQSIILDLRRSNDRAVSALLQQCLNQYKLQTIKI